jgi:DNA-binding ferritin-like protein
MDEATAEFLLTLLHSSTNTHLLHWQTKSYSEHRTLGKFYELILQLTDDLAEAIMGKYDTILTFPVNYYAPAVTGKEEIEALKDYVMQARTQLPQDSEIQNLVDAIADQIDKTLYLLRFP